MLFLHVCFRNRGSFLDTDAEVPADESFRPVAERSISDGVPFLNCCFAPCADLSRSVPLFLRCDLTRWGVLNYRLPTGLATKAKRVNGDPPDSNGLCSSVVGAFYCLRLAMVMPR